MTVLINAVHFKVLHTYFSMVDQSPFSFHRDLPRLHQVRLQQERGFRLTYLNVRMKASVFHITIDTQPSFTTYDKDCKTSSFLIQNLWTNCCFFILGTGLWKRCKGIGRDLVELYVKSPAFANLRKKHYCLGHWHFYLNQWHRLSKERKKEKHWWISALYSTCHEIQICFALHFFSHPINTYRLFRWSLYWVAGGLVTSPPLLSGCQKTVLSLVTLQFLLIPSIFILNDFFFTWLPLGHWYSTSWQQLDFKRNL